MKKLFTEFLGKVVKFFRVEQEFIGQPEPQKKAKHDSLHRKTPKKQGRLTGKKIKEGSIVVHDPRDIRDVMELMEVPFVALSKNRTSPIIYVSQDGKSKVKISRHSEHYLASIYDWDIILFVSSKLQEFINSKKDIPPRTLIVPRHELFKEINRHAGKTTEDEIEAALNRLNSTLIETTINNEDFRYKSSFSFLDSWGYTERKDIKEFRITLSEWLYTITCRNGSLLKIHPEYFKITSGIKRFLYRTARKHVGTKNYSWEFSVERLYEKSGSEQIFRFFKRDLRKSVQDNDVPGYLLEWVEENDKTLVRFINARKLVKAAIASPKNPSPT
jgi:plasmid replication initiation protein